VTDQISKSEDPGPIDAQNKAEDPPPQMFLRKSPGHFFSNKFDIEIVEEHSKSETEFRRQDLPNWLDRLMGLNLLLLILLVGIPVLAYCVLASTR